jgi:hypothetical protein
MNEKIIDKADKNDKPCNKASCRTCQNCIAAEDDGRLESKSNSWQLYAKEAESYFFYYAQRINQCD